MLVHKLRCDHCDAAFKTAKGVPVGTTIKCPKCGDRFEVAAPPEAKKVVKSRSKLPFLLGGLVIALIAAGIKFLIVDQPAKSNPNLANSGSNGNDAVTQQTPYDGPQVPIRQTAYDALSVISPDGQWITGGYQFYMNMHQAVWNYRDGSFVTGLSRPGKPILASGFSPDSSTLAALTPTDVEIWRLPTGTLSKRIPIQAGSKTANLAQFTADGKIIISILKGKLNRIDVATDQVVGEAVELNVENPVVIGKSLIGFTGSSGADPAQLVLSDDITQNTEARSIPLEKTGDFQPRKLVISVDQKTIAICLQSRDAFSYLIQTYDRTTGKLITSAACEKLEVTRNLVDFQLSPDGSKVALVTPALDSSPEEFTRLPKRTTPLSITLFDMKGKLIQVVGRLKTQSMLAFSSDSREVIFKSENYGIQRVPIQSVVAPKPKPIIKLFVPDLTKSRGPKLAEVQTPTNFQLSPDGKSLIATYRGTEGKQMLGAWDISTGVCHASTDVGEDDSEMVAMSPDQRKAAVRGSLKDRVILVDLELSKVLKMWDLPKGQFGGAGNAAFLSFSQDGQTILVSEAGRVLRIPIEKADVEIGQPTNLDAAAFTLTPDGNSRVFTIDQNSSNSPKLVMFDPLSPMQPVGRDLAGLEFNDVRRIQIASDGESVMLFVKSDLSNKVKPTVQIYRNFDLQKSIAFPSDFKFDVSNFRKSRISRDGSRIAVRSDFDEVIQGKETRIYSIYSCVITDAAPTWSVFKSESPVEIQTLLADNKTLVYTTKQGVMLLDTVTGKDRRPN